jgi:putative mycofactocin binding protein MftB
VFDPEGHHRLSPRVGLRPEPFGALAYHFDTRRLVFLKSPELVDLVHALDDHPSAAAAIDAVVAPRPERRPVYVAALASLFEAGVIEPVAVAAGLAS